MSPDLNALTWIVGEQTSAPAEPDGERRSAFVTRIMLVHPGMPREEAEQAFAFVYPIDRDGR